MKIYKLALEKIPEVKGEFTTITTYDGFVYVKPIDDGELKEPFEPSELPRAYQDKIDEIISEQKIKKIIELNRTCDKLLSDFTSSALGTPYIYDMRQEDQINLMGLVIAKVDSFFRCAKLEDPTNKQNLPHTKEQLAIVYSDGLKAKSEIIYICGILKEYLQNLEDIDSIKRLKWEDYEKIKDEVNLGVKK